MMKIRHANWTWWQWWQKILFEGIVTAETVNRLLQRVFARQEKVCLIQSSLSALVDLRPKNLPQHFGPECCCSGVIRQVLRRKLSAPNQHFTHLTTNYCVYLYWHIMLIYGSCRHRESGENPGSSSIVRDAAISLERLLRPTCRVTSKLFIYGGDKKRFKRLGKLGWINRCSVDKRIWYGQTKTNESRNPTQEIWSWYQQ